MSKQWTTVLVVAVVALLAGLGIGAVAWAGGDHSSAMDDSGSAMMDGSNDSTMGHGSDSATTSSSMMGEQAFLEQMVPHHESAIEMATLALENAQRPQVRRLAKDIISSQEKEIAEMKAWHRQWFGSELEAAMTGPHANPDMTQLERATGDDFDRAFLAMMIPHHASAITMCEGVMMGSPRTEISTLTSGITAAQAKEIGQMQQWREQWFPPLG